MLTETKRRRRGHAFLPPKAVLAKVPDLYGTEKTDPDQKMVYIHYLGGAHDFYIVELDQDQCEAFGFTKIHGQPGEWGYIYLPELEEVEVGLVIIERDCHWSPMKFGDIGRAR